MGDKCEKYSRRVLYLLDLDNIKAHEGEKVLNKIKSEIFNRFEEGAVRNLQHFPVLTKYVNFKSTSTMEEYLLNIRHINLHIILSKLRLSHHSPAIEKGRHMRPKL